MKARLLGVGVAVFSLLAGAHAAVLFDSGGFESYALGNIAGQNGWTVDPPATTQFTVSSLLTNGGTKALRADGGDRAWAFPSINYTPNSNESVHVHADIARSIFDSTETAFYGIDIYNSSTDRTVRFGLKNDNGVIRASVGTLVSQNGQQLDPNGTEDLVAFGSTIATDTFVGFDAYLNYNTKTMSLLINGSAVSVLGSFDIPFVDQTATNLAEVDFHVDSVAGATDRGFLDNYRVETVSLAAVPEPGSIGLLAIGGLGALSALRRRRTQTDR